MIGLSLRDEHLGLGGRGFAGTALANDTKQWLEYRLWRAQSANKAWSMLKAADGSNEVRFEVRQGDVASSGARSELTGIPWFAPKSARWTGRGQLLIEAGKRLSSWCLLHQIHQEDAYGSSPIFAIELNTNDTVALVTRNNSGSMTTHATSAAPIVRGQYYLVEYYVDIGGTTGANGLYLKITAADGSTFMTFTGAGLNIGYDAATYNYAKLGVYIDAQPESIAVRWRNFSVALNGVAALAATAASAARALPTPFYDGLSVAPTWCWSTAFQSKAAWTDYAYEHETSLGKIDFIYDQSDNGWGMTQGTDAVRPTDGMSRYLFAPTFDSAGDLMNVSVDNDTSDLLDTSGFYIVAVVQPIGVPANNGATGGGSVNNNPLIFGENSGARNFGVVTRDNGKPLGPWDAQFFVKDSGGEKSTGVADCLSPDMPNLIECWHNGTQITMRVNGGAWSTPVTCGAMVATTGFPRIGHCGTSYTGDILSVATWKTPPSSADSALMLARFYQLQLWWLVGSTLDLDFVNNRGRSATVPYGSAASFLTTTRASTGYADSAAGVWYSFASNVPRITDKGLLVEEARTNSIRNNSMQGAVAGTPGTLPTNWGLNGTANGLTREIVGVGTENGVDYIDVRWFGTASAQIDIAIRPEATTTQVAAASGQSWTASAFFKLVTGANPFSITNFYVLGINSGGSATADTAVTSVTLNGTLTRRSVSITMADATTAAALFTTIFRIPNGTVCDFTLRIGWPQLELGAFATSPIRTTSAAATRAADAISVPAVSSGSRTIFAEGVPTATDAFATAQIIAQLDDGSANERMLLFRISGNPSGTVVIGASSTDYNAIDFGTHSQGANGKYALALETGAQSGVFNGGAISAGTKAGLPAASTTLRVGTNTAGAGQWNGYIRRVAYFPIRLTNAQLQVLTQ